MTKLNEAIESMNRLRDNQKKEIEDSYRLRGMPVTASEELRMFGKVMGMNAEREIREIDNNYALHMAHIAEQLEKQDD